MPTNWICTLCIVVMSLLPLVRTAHAQNDKAASEQKSAGDIARLLSAFELEKLHSKQLDERKFSEMNEKLAKAMIPDDFGYSWKTNIIRRDQLNDAAKANDDFEKQAIASLKAGQDKVLEVHKDGVIRFARVVRTLNISCAACHNDSPNSKLEPTRIIGIVCLEISPKEKKP
jgi:hypothetical protein